MMPDLVAMELVLFHEGDLSIGYHGITNSVVIATLAFSLVHYE